MLREWHCSIKGCVGTTTIERHPDPRHRWMLDVILQDQDETVVVLNLCPVHVKEMFRLNEDWYQTIENSEKLIRGDELDEQNHGN
jgi:hypothetical protein